MEDHEQDDSHDLALERQALELFQELCDADSEEQRARLGEELERVGKPASIAGYEILEELGRGGMGVVYRARQRNPERIVAIKVMRPGISNDEMLRRFEFEAEVLARLDHPGIARIIEAGTAEVAGIEVPFFAMQFIEGRVLSRAAEELGLDINQRVRLLREIALAVHHAHLKGVVHRDLKPSNILVTSEGRPKILDFGVARAVSPDDQLTTLNTAPGEIVGTLAYMSPEQVSGDSRALDVRTDIYSLGAIAYELLSGSLPLDLRGKPLAEAARLILDQDITPLGRATRGDGDAQDTHRDLRGDLETIIGKALEKDKQRRYASTAALAEDLRRFLEHEPILARPPTTLYQFKKFSRRHRVLLSAVTVVFLTLIVALFHMAGSTRRARAAEREALAKGEVQAAVNGFIETMFGSIAPKRLGSTGFDTRVVDVLAQASQDGGESLAEHPAVELELRRLFASTYGGLSDTDSAMNEIDRALELCAQLGLEGRAYRDCLHIKASLLRGAGDAVQAEPLFRQLIAAAAEESGPESEELCSHLNSMSLTLKALGRLPEAKQLLEAAQPALLQGLGEDNLEYHNLLHNLGVSIALLGDYPAGAEMLTRVLELRRRVEGPAHVHTMLTQMVLGSLLNAMHETGRADDLLREGVAIPTRSWARTPCRPGTARARSPGRWLNAASARKPWHAASRR